jgi:hypothetical protein
MYSHTMNTHLPHRDDALFSQSNVAPNIARDTEFHTVFFLSFHFHDFALPNSTDSHSSL